LDAETRGIIFAIINNAFENQNVLETINWVLESDNQVRSKEDLALGYIVGSLINIADKVASGRKLIDKLNKQGKEILKKSLGKEQARKMIEEQRKRVEEIKAKGGRRIKSELTDGEIYDIKNMLIPMISGFREKIRKEEALRKART